MWRTAGYNGPPIRQGNAQGTLMMLRILLVIFLVGQGVSAPAQESATDDKPPVYTADQIRADFEFMYQGLQAANVDLYSSTPRGAFESHYRKYRSGFNRPMTRFEAEMAFQKFVALAHQAHTRVESDYSGYFAYRGAGGAGFPLDIAVVDDQLIITKNRSGISRMLPGDRIRAVNGVQTTELLPRLTAHLSAETPEFAYVLLELYMPLVMWLELGDARAYSVSVDHADGTKGVYEISTAADEEPDSGQEDEPFSLEGHDARMLTESVAYLRPGPFNNTDQGANPLDTTTFVKFIDETFAEFIDSGADQLILDLRDNSGGSNSFSDPMVAWFADRPFRFSSDFRVRVSPQSTAANQARLDASQENPGSMSQLYAKLYASTENGQTVLFPIPEVEPRPAPRFEGDVYVLVNRYSFSNAVTTAALIQDYGFGVIMGEQTADMATTYGAMERFNLPNTGIVVAYPKALIVRPNGNESAHPVSPDLPLPSPRVRGADDEMLQAALEHIQARQAQ